MQDKKTPVKKGRSRITKNDILELAMKRFEVEEYDAIQMNELAQELEVSNGTIFYHFPTKQTLFYEIYNIYYAASMEDNLKRLESYENMTPKELKDYLLVMMENIFDNHFHMLRLMKIHSMVLDKGIVLDRIEASMNNSVALFGKMLKELHKRNTYLSMEELLDILNARSSMLIGYFYMFMEPKIIDQTWSTEKRAQQKNIYKDHVMKTLDAYLAGRLF